MELNKIKLPIKGEGIYYIANYVKWYGRYFSIVKVKEIKVKEHKYYYSPDKSSFSFSIKLKKLKCPHSKRGTTSWIHGLNVRNMNDRFVEVPKEVAQVYKEEL